MLFSSYFKLTGLWKDQLGSRLAFDSTAQKYDLKVP